MDISQAYMICHRYFADGISDSEENFATYCEAAEYIVSRTGDPDVLCGLGAAYYKREDYREAKKYYEMSAAKGNTDACLGLGYIWYYGRTGERDYKKAFECFSMARNSINAEYKLAEMYLTGKYVKKDEGRYRAKIEKIYDLIRKTGDDSYVPEIFSRLARIRTEQGRKEEAVPLLTEARRKLASRLEQKPSSGDLILMKSIVEDMYSLIPFNYEHFGLYDLFFLMREPCTVTFTCRGSSRIHTVTSTEDSSSMTISFDGTQYESVTDLLQKASSGGEKLTAVCRHLTDFRIS